MIKNENIFSILPATKHTGYTVAINKNSHYDSMRSEKIWNQKWIILEKEIENYSKVDIFT